VKPTPAAPQPPAVAPAAMLQRDVPVPQGSKLAQFFGRDSATLQQLLDVTLRQDDAALRLEALRAGMSAIETQEDLRAAAVKALSETDDSRLESAFRALARDRAQEIASQMVSLSRSPEIRARSVKLLRQLTAGGSGGATP
jgi:hypothetical protein